MNDERPWYREPESFIALAALIVSVSAVVVGLYEAALQRKHDRAEVWPRLEIQTMAGQQGATIGVASTGIGPAIVEYSVATVDGMSVHNWQEVLARLNGRAPGPISNSTVGEHAVRPGEQVALVTIPSADLPADFWKTIQRVSIRICYRSVFDDRWQLDAHPGAGDSTYQVKTCPPQPRGMDF